MAQITLNGRPHPLPAATTVSALLLSLEMDGRPVVVELNGQALTPAEHEVSEVADGAKVELITLAAGG